MASKLVATLVAALILVICVSGKATDIDIQDLMEDVHDEVPIVAQHDVVPVIIPTTVDPEPISTSTQTQKPSSSTAAPTPAPTTAPPTTTAMPSTTTTATTTTTTAKTTTSATTTAKPATTTTTAPTTVTPPTTAKPSPKPAPVKPDIGKWMVKDKNQNVTCIILQMATQLNFTYMKMDNTTVETLYNLPANHSKVSGRCGNETDEMEIMFGQKEDNTMLNVQFVMNTTSSEFYISGMTFTINVTGDVFPGAKANQTIVLHEVHAIFATPMDRSYHCTKVQAINLTASSTDDKPIALAELSHLQFEAFRKDGNDQFSFAKDCDATDSPDIVAIAVGLSLAGLIFVVLIAYLVARRRSHSSGYVSM